MGQDGEKEPQIPRRSKKRTARGGAKLAQTRQLHRIEPLVVKRAGQELCRPLVRLLEPGGSQQAQLCTPGDLLSGPALRERTDVTELPSTPPASRDFEELFVPDSPEQGRAVGKDSSHRRLCKMPRTPPTLTNFEELVVPDSPEETWASPQKSSRTPPTSTNFEEFVVPESPEQSGDSKDLCHRPFKLRRTRLRNLHPELVNDSIEAGLGRARSELIPVGTSKRSEKRSFKNAADSGNFDRSQHLYSRLPIMAAEKISDQHAPIGVSRDVDQPSQLIPTPGGSGNLNKVFGDEELDNRTLYVPDTEDSAPITPFSTISGVRAVSSMALGKPRAFLLDESLKETETRARARARPGKDLHRHGLTPIRSSTGDPAPRTPFPIASEKPVSVPFRPLKKARALHIRGELDSFESTAELAGAGHQKNVSRDVSTPEMGVDNLVPASSIVTGSGKPVLLSSTELQKASASVDNGLKGSRMCHEFARVGNQWNLHRDVQSCRLSNSEDAGPINSISVGSGNTLLASTDVQIPMCTVIHGADPIKSFITGRGKPVPVSSNALEEKARKLLNDEFEGTESEAEFPGAGYRGNVHIDAKPVKFSNTEDVSPINSSSMAMKKTLSASRDVQPPPTSVVDCAFSTTTFVSNSSMALKKPRAELGGEFEGLEKCTGYPGNLNRDVQIPLVSNIEDAPPTNSSTACGRTLHASRCVTSTGTYHTVPITSFVTGSGKPVAPVSSKALEKVRLLLGDQLEETETIAEVPRAGDQGTLSKSLRNPPISVSTVPLNNATGLPGDRVTDYRITGVGMTLNTFSTRSGKPFSVPSLASEKASVHFGKDGEENDVYPTSRRNQGLGNQVPSFNDTLSTENGMLESASNYPLKKAEILLKDRVKDDGSSGRMTLSTFSTGNGKPISVSSLAMKKVLLRDEEIENDDCPPLPKPTGHGNKHLGRTSDRSVLGNSNFDAPVSPRGDGECPRAKPARELAVSVPSKAHEKGKAPLGDDEKENCVEYEGVSNLECLQRRHLSRNSELTTDRTRRPLSEIQVGCSISQASDKGEKLSPARGNLGGSCSSQRVERKEIPQGNPPSRTRSGRAITISSEAILDAKVRLGAGVIEGNVSEAAEKTKNFDGKSTFTTGSGRTVTISREAIERATTLLADGIKSASLREPSNHLSAEIASTHVPSPTPTFRTPSGRTVAISSEAMSRAKDLLAPRGFLPTVQSLSHDRGLNLKCFLTEETYSSQNENAGYDVTASRVGPYATVTPPHPSKLYWDEKVGQPAVVTNQSPQLNFSNPDCSTSRAKPPSAAGADNQWRNVRAFKPPRIRKQPDDTVTSEGNLSTLISGAGSCGNQRSSSDWACVAHELQLPRPAYFQDRVGPGGRKLREYIGRPPASQVFSSSNELRSMTADAAESYRIQHVRNEGRRESVGSTEIWELLLGLGADTLYASKEWVANHYKWIMWKLASLERKYAQQVARRPVTLDTVLNELKYRYDTELSGLRSTIRRITEGDSSASRAMVLCVSSIRHTGDNGAIHEHIGKVSSSDTAKIEVTDGWYRLNAVLDAPLTEQLRKGKLQVGQKIRVCGATLCCCSDSTSPLEAFRDSFLTLHMNGTYRAHQNHRMGFCRGSCLPLAFRSIKPDGGLVPKTYVGVTRVYPILFKEISADGTSIVRAARAEETAANHFEQRRAKVVEEAILKLETSSNTLSSQEEDEGCRLFDAVERAAEPDILMADMTPVQLKAFAVYQAKKETSRQAAVEDVVKKALQEAGLNTRNVKRFLKVRVTGLQRKSHKSTQVGQQTKEGTIAVWDVNDEQNIVEGSVYCVSGLRPGTWASSGKEDHLQLQSYRSTSWRLVPEAIHEKHFLFPYACRVPTRLSELDEKSVNREFDVAATVLQVGEPLERGSRTNQWVFVTDGSTALNSPGDTWDEMQILAVKVNLPTLAFAPVEPSLVGSVVGFCNLIQQPKDQISHMWVAEASELSFFSSNLTSRPLKHLQAAANCVSKWATSSRWAIDHLRDLIQALLWEGSQ